MSLIALGASLFFITADEVPRATLVVSASDLSSADLQRVYRDGSASPESRKSLEKEGYGVWLIGGYAVVAAPDLTKHKLREGLLEELVRARLLISSSGSVQIASSLPPILAEVAKFNVGSIQSSEGRSSLGPNSMVGLAPAATFVLSDGVKTFRSSLLAPDAGDRRKALEGGPAIFDKSAPEPSLPSWYDARVGTPYSNLKVRSSLSLTSETQLDLTSKALDALSKSIRNWSLKYSEAMSNLFVAAGGENWSLGNAIEGDMFSMQDRALQKAIRQHLLGHVSPNGPFRSEGDVVEFLSTARLSRFHKTIQVQSYVPGTPRGHVEGTILP
ncbi:MAG: hypothetical protein KIT11_02210 [Fimbriimonadaceae bacterium]|nr:hypothetical protein [Fimbriimonadaceae bacterium]QYK54818.1 MAG: hypothetical protein KF733_07325 [Fimbriimonadaceae bacterium]